MASNRTYELFGQTRTGPFSVYTIDYSRGSHPWLVTVQAVSSKQAKALAARGVWSTDRTGVGIRRIYGRQTEEMAPWLRFQP